MLWTTIPVQLFKIIIHEHLLFSGMERWSTLSVINLGVKPWSVNPGIDQSSPSWVRRRTARFWYVGAFIFHGYAVTGVGIASSIIDFSETNTRARTRKHTNTNTGAHGNRPWLPFHCGDSWSWLFDQFELLWSSAFLLAYYSVSLVLACVMRKEMAKQINNAIRPNNQNGLIKTPTIRNKRVTKS